MRLGRPEEGDAAAVQGLLSGETSVIFTGVAAGGAQVKAGKMKVLAVSTRERLAAMPDIPTMEESGIADYDVFAWIAVVVPSGTPPPIVSRLNRELNAALAAPEFVKRVEAFGMLAMPGSPEQMAELVRRDNASWARSSGRSTSGSSSGGREPYRRRAAARTPIFRSNSRP